MKKVRTCFALFRAYMQLKEKSGKKVFIGDSLNSSAIDKVLYLSQILAMDH